MCRHTLPSTTRRSLLAAVGSATVVPVAGCLGRNLAESGDSTAEGSGSEDDRPDFPDHPGDEPRAPPEDRVCDGPCGMRPSGFPEWNAQLAHEDGQGAFFDTPGCLLAYRNDPTFYDGPAAAIGNAWVRDFDSGELIDATTAFFVLDYDKERLEEPMAHNPKPFRGRADAVAYVDAYDDLEEGDIVGIDGFGDAQAHRYRDYPIPDDG